MTGCSQALLERLDQRLYQEIMALTLAVRDYMASEPRCDPERGGGMDTDRVREEGRLTARSLELMAWALGRRAAAAGEVSYAEARERWGLSNPVFHKAELSDAARRKLPPRCRELLDRSLTLYRRIEHFDYSA